VEIEATPPGAARPSVTYWNPRPGRTPPVAWWPATGEFASLWDYQLSEALALPGVWRARMTISQAIGGMPLSAWKGTTLVEPTPSLLSQPNPDEQRQNTVAAWVCDLLDHGNAVGVVTRRDSEGRATEVAPIPAVEVEVGRDPDSGAVRYRFGGGATLWDAGDVFHAKGSHRPGALRGMGVLESGLSSFARMHAEADYASRSFASGYPGGLLKVKNPDLVAGDPDDPPGFDTAVGIKQQWKNSVASGDIAVMSELVDFQALSWTPTDAQMIEARQMSLVDTANLYNMDPYWVGASQVSAPYQNVQQSAMQLFRFTLGFWVSVLEGQFSRFLPRGTEARFNRDSLLRDDEGTRAAINAQYLAAGVRTVDEVRASEGLPPLGAGEPLSPAAPMFAGGSGNEAVA